jgi:hypothetical protein
MLSPRSLEHGSERETYFHLFVLQWRYRLRLDERLAGRDALAPGRDCAFLVVTLKILPVGNDEVGVPLVEVADTAFMKQLHAETGGLVFVVVKDIHECAAVTCILQWPELFCERWGDPLDTVPEKMQEDETLHLEIHVRIDSESQAVEDARARRLQVAIFDGEAIFDDFGSNPNPNIHQWLRGHRADQSVADQFMPRDLPSVPLSTDSFVFHDRPILPNGPDCNKGGVSE